MKDSGHISKRRYGSLEELEARFGSNITHNAKLVVLGNVPAVFPIEKKDYGKRKR